MSARKAVRPLHQACCCRRSATAVLSTALALVIPCGTLQAQQWRGRLFTRIQYVEARPLRLDSVPIAQTSGGGRQRQFGEIPVTCATGASYCFFYRAGAEVWTAPLVQDVDVTVWGFGIEGLRAYLSTRFRAAGGDDAFWPRTDDHFDLLAAYVELNRSRYRVRLGRDYQVSGLGYYGYDGASAQVRLPRARLELEAYGGWGLERGLPEPVTSEALASLEEFQPRRRNLLFGVRGSARLASAMSFETIYQREIATDRSGLASERVAVDAAYAPSSRVALQAHGDYDLAAQWWGKAGATVGIAPRRELYVEARLLRYRPTFSLQTIWVAFSPTPYTGWGLAVAVQPSSDLSLRVEGERRSYADTEAEVPFQVTTDRTWRAGASGRWSPAAVWNVEGGYWLDFGFGAGLSAGELRLNVHPRERLTVTGRASFFQLLEEFRVGEGRVWGLGAGVQWDSPVGTVWGSLDGYRHDRRGDALTQPDWTQARASFGLAVYLGSEPGERR